MLQRTYISASRRAVVPPAPQPRQRGMSKPQRVACAAPDRFQRSPLVRELVTQPAGRTTEAFREVERMLEPPDAPMSRIAYRNFRKISTDERDVRSPHSRPRACPPSGALFVCLSKDRANRRANAWPSRWPRLSTKSPAVAFLRDQGEGTTKSSASHCVGSQSK